ncbi:MAG: hypothetical protein R2856_36190 [Caldilineaceae bacterium]
MYFNTRHPIISIILIISSSHHLNSTKDLSNVNNLLDHGDVVAYINGEHTVLRDAQVVYDGDRIVFVGRGYDGEWISTLTPAASWDPRTDQPSHGVWHPHADVPAGSGAA